MSNLPGNPYAEGVDQAIEGGAAVMDPEAFALMALAFEQRTANMIALYAADEACAQGINHANGWDIDNWVDLAKTITARLGLDKS